MEDIKNIIPLITKNIDWDVWLKELHTNLIYFGYRKGRSFKNEDYSYYKTVSNKYQCIVLVYDHRKYIDVDKGANRVGLMFECMLSGVENRFNLTISFKDLSIINFELFCELFYLTFKPYNK